MHGDLIAADVLRADLRARSLRRTVSSSASSIAKQLLRPERPVRAVKRDLRVGPRVEAAAGDLETLFGPQRRIVRDHSEIDGVLEQMANNFAQIVGRVRRFRLFVDDGDEVLALEMRDALVAVLAAEAFRGCPGASPASSRPASGTQAC